MGLVARGAEGAWAEAEMGAGAAAATGWLGVAPEGAAVCGGTIRALSSDCWITFTPSGLFQADSRVRAL